MSDAFAKQPGPSLDIASTKGMVEETTKNSSVDKIMDFYASLSEAS